MFRKTSLIIIGLVLSGCRDKYFSEHELDSTQFEEETMTYIEETVNLDIPDNAKGLNFYYKPPVDPIFLAKIQIPEESEQEIKAQIIELTDIDDFPDNFGNFDFRWWLSDTDEIIVSRKAYVDGYFVEAYLVRDSTDELVFYLKYFTI